MQRSLTWIAIVLALCACEKRAVEPQAASEASRAAAKDGLDAPCAEHGVLAAVCTRCNPKLVAVFKDKGDWCAAHDWPESFCPICHPERGGRPAADTSADEAPADGTKIRFQTPDTAHLAGIETVPALADPDGARVVAVARLTYDATRVAHVNARAAGVIRAIHADVGMRVGRGTPLVEIESAAVGADQSKLAAARARTAVAEAEHARTLELVHKGILPAKELLVAEQELAAARAEQQATLEALRVVGSSSADAAYTLVAPLGGIVTQRRSTIGTLVDLEEMLFEIVDPTVLWAEIDIPEADLAVVAPGQRVVLEIDGLAGHQVEGTIDYVAPAIDLRTRTALARMRLRNPGGLLRANMYGRARIAVGEARGSVLVPRSALQYARGTPVAFVQLAVDLYETRRVTVGPADGDQVTLARGVRPGERVVTQGSFLLKTETLRGSIGAGCCEAVAKK